MISSFLLFVTLANAQDFAQVQKGQPAPFAGTLLTPESIAVIISKHDSDVAMCLAESDHKLQEQEIKCELQVQKAEYDFSSYKMTSEALIQEKNKELDKAYDIIKKQSKNQTPLWLGIGFATGFATSLGAIYVYNNL
jgi:2-phosphoglycerate kinase